jgi:hypothetical protein
VIFAFAKLQEGLERQKSEHQRVRTLKVFLG